MGAPTLSTFQGEIAGGSLYVGSPETVATKLADAIRLLGLSRFDLAYAVGRVPHEQRMATIELLRARGDSAGQGVARGACYSRAPRTRSPTELIWIGSTR